MRLKKYLPLKINFFHYIQQWIVFHLCLCIAVYYLLLPVAILEK